MKDFCQTRDVTTGRYTKMACAGRGKDWQAHQGQEAWWLVYYLIWSNE